MTSRIVRLVRSLDYRQRLLEGVEDIEREIIDYAQRHNLRTIGGYRLDISDDNLRMTRLPPDDLDQLQLFESMEEQVGSSSLVAEYSRPEGQPYRKFRIRLRPRKSDSSPRITSPADVYEVLPEMRTLDREYFMSLHLNTKNRLSAVETIAVGTLNASLLHPREVFRGAMLNNASCLIVAHNHPSGDPSLDHA